MNNFQLVIVVTNILKSSSADFCTYFIKLCFILFLCARVRVLNWNLFKIKKCKKCNYEKSAREKECKMKKCIPQSIATKTKKNLKCKKYHRP